jgi:hypothetical protein
MKTDVFGCVRVHVDRPIENPARLASLEGQDLMDITEVGSTQRPQSSLIVGGPVPTVEERVTLTYEIRSEEQGGGASKYHGPLHQNLASDFLSCREALPVWKCHAIHPIV